MPRCKICKDKYEAKYFLQKTCLDPTCILEYKNVVKAKEWKKEKAVLKEKLKTREDYYQETLKVFNKYIRIRDKGQPCISCDAPAGTYKITSGHFYPQGTYRNIALNEDNANGQCWYNCNKNKHGNLLEYRPRLIKKIGIKRVEELDRLRNETRKYSIPELIEMKVILKDKIKALQNEAN